MKLARIQISNDTSNKLNYLQTRTRLTPNILMRIGFGLSLRDPSILEPFQYPEDGKELNRYTITGELDTAFVTLLKEWLERNNLPQDNAVMIKYFRAHLNRGARILIRRVKTLNDLVLLD